MKATLAILFALSLGMPAVGDDKEKDEEFFETTNALAQKGNIYAQYTLGAMYYNGIGVKRDFKEALKWYQESSNQGSAYGMFALGGMYSQGAGIVKSQEEAVKWYHKSAGQGLTVGQSILAMYYTGRLGGIKEDYVKAYAWGIIAGANGDNGVPSASEFLKFCSEKMTPEQITKAQILSKDMVKKSPKLLSALKLPDFDETLPEDPTKLIQRNRFLLLLH